MTPRVPWYLVVCVVVGLVGTLAAIPAHCAEPEDVRCLTRAEYADRVLGPLRDLALCRQELSSSETVVAAQRVALEVAVAEAQDAQARVERMRRARWRWVAVGVGGTLAAGVLGVVVVR